MRILIIGFGSIGQRHSSIASEFGHQLGLVSQQLSTPYPSYRSVPAALDQFRPELVIISNITSDHSAVHSELRALKYNGPILMEKPVAMSLEQVKIKQDANTYVAYNLRWHPAVQKVKLALQEQKVLSAQFYVGQNLLKWNTQRDYRTSYRASVKGGGGVLGDLSHEIDLIQYLLGPIRQIAAIGGHKSTLEIATDDIYCALFKTKTDVFGTLEINYVDHNTTRFFNIVCDKNTFRGDLVNHELVINGELESMKIDSNFTYKEQLRQFLDNPKKLCSYQEGIHVVDCIVAMEKSARDEKWITI